MLQLIKENQQILKKSTPLKAQLNLNTLNFLNKP